MCDNAKRLAVEAKLADALDLLGRLSEAILAADEQIKVGDPERAEQALALVLDEAREQLAKRQVAQLLAQAAKALKAGTLDEHEFPHLRERLKELL